MCLLIEKLSQIPVLWKPKRGPCTVSTCKSFFCTRRSEAILLQRYVTPVIDVKWISDSAQSLGQYLIQRAVDKVGTLIRKLMQEESILRIHFSRIVFFVYTQYLLIRNAVKPKLVSFLNFPLFLYHFCFLFS